MDQTCRTSEPDAKQCLMPSPSPICSSGMRMRRGSGSIDYCSAIRLWFRWSMIFSEKTGPAFRAHVLIRRHEDRKPETGEVMQRLIDADQRPEPGMFLVDAEGRGAQSLGAIDRDVNDEVDEGDEPEFRCDDQDQEQRNRKGNQTMRQERQPPAGLLVLADRHPGILQEKIR